MCGITGAVGGVDDGIATAVRTMSQNLAHRGPDADGEWRHENDVMLAHRRLAILDLSEAGNQPMVDPERGTAIAYNGEVYNFADIRSQLAALGHQFRSETDTEVVLRAYGQWGPDCVRRFRGMFAFVIWDSRTRQVVFARDRLGIKPLYWACVESGGNRSVLFSSEVRSLLATGLLARQLNPEGLSTYLWNGFVHGTQSIVDGVFELPAGSTAVVDVDRPNVDPTPYWTLPLGKPDAEAAARLRAELAQAVGMRLVADVPVGVFLSGGIDSSAVTALAARAAGQEIDTFNIAFEEVDYDESSYARAVASALGTRHHEIPLPQSTFGAQLNDALDSIDQPTFDQVNTYIVSRAVREAGIKVALAGTGGDELFGGYTSFRDLPAAAAWGRRLRPVPERLLRFAAGLMARLKMGRPGPVPPQTRWGRLGDALAARGRMVDLYQVSCSLFTEAFFERLYAGDTGESHRGVNRDWAARMANDIAGIDELEAVSRLELSCFLEQRLLRDSDAASMAVSLELRVPLIDHVVVESLAGVETNHRFLPVRSKRLLREVALDRVDKALFDRPKRGFELPFELWIREGMKREVEETLLDAQLCRSAGLNATEVERLWRAFESGAPGIYWSRVWSLFVLLRWCQRHGMSL